MTWKEMLFQALVGLVEILAGLGKAIGTVLVYLIKIWEPICCAAMGYILGNAIACLIDLEPSSLRNEFQWVLAFLGLVFGATLATRRISKSGRQ